MRTILLIILKEFKQIFRNKAMLPVMFVAPIIQLLILPNAATFEIKNIKLAIIDHNQSSMSRELISKLTANNYFKLVANSKNSDEAEKLMENGKIDLYVDIPQNFERNIIKENFSKIGVVVNSIDGSKAGVAFNYFLNILNNFQNEESQLLQSKVNLQISELPKIINVNFSTWFNISQNYKFFMVPGILVLLVTMVGEFLASMNIVREKEIGTIEQINVTPIKKYQFLIGKLVPFWIIGMFELFFGILISLVIFKVPFLGSPLVIAAFASIYLILVLGIGLFISTITETQQQSMFVSWFFLVIFILLSGLFTAVENMPTIIQNITLLNPVRYFIEVIRMVMLKGSGFADVKLQFLIITLYAILINALAVWKYKKTS